MSLDVLQKSWLPFFASVDSLITKILKEVPRDAIPDGYKTWRVFDLPPDEIKVVILGQDPYPNPQYANGLAFSVDKGITIPQSLKNIFKELESDLGIPQSSHGDLTKWHKQGVFLLNTALTTMPFNSNVHKDIWHPLTNKVIQYIHDNTDGVIFVLWGNRAKYYANSINEDKHYILSAAHPSPLSAHKGFFGCKHFSQINSILKHQGKSEIDWKLE